MRLMRRELLIGGGLAASGLAALAMRARTPDRNERVDMARLMPERFGAWTMQPAGEVVLHPDALSESIYESVIARRFVAPGAPPVTLVAAYSAAQSYASQLHRPEICYPASGYAVGTVRPASIALPDGSLPAATLDARRRDYAEAILYWLRVGDVYPESLWDQRLVIARRALLGSPSEGAIVRLSCAASGDGSDQATLSGFTQALWKASGNDGRRLLFGPLIASPPKV